MIRLRVTGEGRDITVEPRSVVLAGYTGRDQELVRAHVAELAAHGVAVPERTPTFYAITPDRVVQVDRIAVLGERTSGEAEFVMVLHGRGRFIGVASDHTDRAAEADSVRLSKQLCPKVIGTDAWTWDDAMDHWDHLTLRAFSGEVAAPYQESPVTALLDPGEILALAEARTGRSAGGDTLVFSGTLGLARDLEFANRFTVELVDDAHDRALRASYLVDVVEPID